MFRDLKANEIDCRISQINEKGLSLLLYKDARVDMDILDETVGAKNWQRSHTRDNANCIIEIWDEYKKQWICKEDTGTESFTEKEKGLASDSFKRAGFNWGIGRELYTAPFIYVPLKDKEGNDNFILKEKNAKATTNTKFYVEAIQITNKEITGLSIKNDKGKRVFVWKKQVVKWHDQIQHGTITDINIDFDTTKPKISLLLDTNDKDTILQLKKEDKLNIELKKWYQKRSLDANAYCWVLCDKIAKELSKDGTVITKEQVYKDAILQIGTFEPMIIELKAYDNFKRIWEKQGLGFLVQEVSKKDKCIKVHCYYGSSTYNSKEMSLLIELIVGLAESLNIETKSQAEIDSLLESWDKK